MSNATTIAAKNDLCRETFLCCKIALTESVSYSPDREEIVSLVRSFSDFNHGNDPYGEHDFGSFDVKGNAYFWKFDYFDDAFKFFKEDGRRLLTIGSMADY